MTQKERFNYYNYEMQVRNLEIVEKHLQGFLPYFAKCQHVIDVGCGTGLFLQMLLHNAGIAATGIENNPGLVEKLRSQGLNVIQGSADSIWPSVNCKFDGLFCSHLIEHLEFEQVVDLIEGFADKIATGGIAVFAFPNPESLQMQLFHFWIDPQHVRFYHPKLIEAILCHYGFEITHSFSQGHWGPSNNIRSPQPLQPIKTNGNSKQPSPLRKFGRTVKKVLGIRNVEIEADYVRKLREVGREAVIVARKKED